MVLLGLSSGTVLLVDGTRRHLLGLPGVFVCGFIGVLLAAFAGITLFLSSTGSQRPQPPSEVGVFHANHLATVLALLGFEAAMLLVVSPWSPQRRRVQPWLIVGAVLLPAAAILVLRNHVGSQPSSSRNGLNAILFLGPIAGLLAGPLQAASAIEWVSFNVRSGRYLGARLGRSDRSLLVFFGLEATWLGLGISRTLPAALGRHWLAWSLLRVSVGAWAEAIALTVLGIWFLHRYCGRVELDEATSGAYVPGVALSDLSLGAALVVFLIAARFALYATLPRGSVPILIGFAAFVAGVGFVVGGPRGPLSSTWRWIAAIVLFAGVTLAGLQWPTATRGVLGGSFHREFYFAVVGKAISSTGFIAGGITLYALIGIGLWIGYRVLTRRTRAANARDQSDEDWLPVLLIPLTCWFGLLAVAAAARLGAAPLGLRTDAFVPPLLPDPVVFAVTGLAVIAPILLLRRREDAFRRGLLGLAVALPVLAFAPFVVPASFQPGGRLVIFALALPLLYALIIRASEFTQRPDSWRRLSWLAGTTAISLPLLAYTNLLGPHHGALTAVLSDTGATRSDLGPMAHLRAVLLLPLLVGLAAANRRPEDVPRRARTSRVRDFEASVLLQSVDDGDLNEFFLNGLREHLSAVPGAEIRTCAAKMAGRLASQELLVMPLRWREVISKAAHVARQHARGLPNPSEALAFARRTAAPVPAPGKPGHALEPTTTSDPAWISISGVNSATAIARSALAVALADDRFDSVDTLVSLHRAEVEAAALRCDASKDPVDRERSDKLARKELANQLDAIPQAFSLFPFVRQELWFAPSVVLNDPPGPPRTPRADVLAPYPWLLVGLAGLIVFIGLLIPFLDLLVPPR
jgi:hypothetical protein